MIQKIITVPHKLLRQKSEPVGKIDKKIKKIIDDLLITVKEASDPEGLGLSAIQIGQPVRIFVAKIGRNFEVFINPEIKFYSKKKLKGILPKEKLLFEGCLSVPRIYGFVNRPFEIQISWQDEKGQKKTKRFKDKLSVCIQHEFDHLEGLLFTDRLLKEKGRIYELKKDEKGEDYFEEVSI